MTAYLVDQNYFRSTELAALMSADPDATFVVPDVALIEMCKGPHWQDTVRSSLATLAQAPARVSNTIAVGEALMYEFTNKRSAYDQLRPPEFQSFFHAILKDVRENTMTAGMNAIAVRIAETQTELSENELDHSRNLAGLRGRMEIIEDALGADAIRQFKNSNVDRLVRLRYIRKIGRDLTEAHTRKEGFSEDEIAAFMSSKPVILRTYYLSVRHALEWAIRQGLNSLPQHRATNDVLDQDYVLLASFFDVLLSKETRMLDADQDLRDILAMDA